VGDLVAEETPPIRAEARRDVHRDVMTRMLCISKHIKFTVHLVFLRILREIKFRPTLAPYITSLIRRTWEFRDYYDVVRDYLYSSR